MKKLITVLFVVALLVLSVCFLLFRNATYTLDKLTEKFNKCYNRIESVTDKHNLESKNWATDEINSLKHYYIIINDKQRIDITFSTNATETQKGNGTFSISYTISEVNDDDDNNFDVDLFTEIVNLISGKTITTDFLTEFLTEPEEKYSVEKYGLSGGGYAVEKIQALNFWEDWVISYELTYDNDAELQFYGYIR